MNIMDPFIRVAENDRWRALVEFYKRKTNEAQDTLCEGTQVDDDLITEGATVTHDGNILADTHLIRNELESGTTADTIKYRQVFTDLYGISIDDADKYIAHPQLVRIWNIRASLCTDVWYVPAEAEDLLVERIDPWLDALHQIPTEDWTRALAQGGELDRLLGVSRLRLRRRLGTEPEEERANEVLTYAVSAIK
ncbi:hypothetical protein LTS18_006565 [Coniosporium uncinatum]|uniref:Uncharacterized protein n=1 Tax=Coniosporium uncinatum TaxID=93489 RepID=A0ACC3DQ52_9PEZI|nr:hypothetical protein LTS18_006565 [Coniosporium uncinatum]